MKLFRLICLGGALSVVGVGSIEAQWIPTGGPMEGWTLSLVAHTGGSGDTVLFAGAHMGCVFRSTNYGTDWEQIDGGTRSVMPGDTGFTSKDVRLLAACDNGHGAACLFAVDEPGHLFRSLNADTHWTAINIGRGPHGVTALFIDSLRIFAGTDSGCFISTDLGDTWQYTPNELTSFRVLCFSVYSEDSVERNVLAGTNGGVFRSSDGGMTWTAVNTSMLYLFGFVFGQFPSGSTYLYGFDGATGRVFRSSDYGVSWNEAGDLFPFLDPYVYCLTTHDTVLFAGTSMHGVFYSLDGGGSWTESLAGMLRRRVHTLMVCGNYIFAGVDSDIGSLSSVWRRPLAEIPTTVDCPPIGLPSQFSVSQAYPNPFNASTVIQYELSHAANVDIAVFNILGQPISRLVDRYVDAGRYSVHFDANGLASGVYFCRFNAEGLVQSRRLILQK